MKSAITKTATSFSFPELHANKLINKSIHVVDLNIDRYDMIIGHDLIRSIGIDIHGADMTIHWDDIAIHWRDIDSTTKDVFALSQYNAPFNSETKRTKRILDAKYSKADLKTIAKISTHIDPQERNKLYTLLKKYECLFDGNLGTWHGKTYDIKLKPDAEPYHGTTFPVPCIHYLTFKQELDQLEALKVIKKVNRSQWGAPTFITPKKDSTVRFISDFRELNKRILRQPYPIPKIQYLLLRLEGFRYGTTLDLNMGYYHIEQSVK